MATEGSRSVEVGGLGDKHQVTATSVATLDGTFLPVQILHQEKTEYSHPKYTFPDGVDAFHCSEFWANEHACLHSLGNRRPYIKKV